MQMKDRTKIMFAESLEEMLHDMPLDKVRIVKLCEKCGATTPTFYYYFHDKYELVAWMFLQDFAGAFADREPDYNPVIMNQATSRFAKRRNFYQKAFDDRSQNSIAEYLIAFNIQISREAVQFHTGKDLTTDQEFSVRYHIYGVMGMFCEWLFGKNISAEYLNTCLYEKTPDFLKEAFSVYPYSTDNLLGRAGKETTRK